MSQNTPRKKASMNWGWTESKDAFRSAPRAIKLVFWFSVVLSIVNLGIMIGPYVGSLRAGDPFTFQFVMPMSDGEKFSFSVWANVVRVDGHGLAARYVDLNDRVSNMIGKMLDMLMVPQ